MLDVFFQLSVARDIGGCSNVLMFQTHDNYLVQNIYRIFIPGRGSGHATCLTVPGIRIARWQAFVLTNINYQS